MERLNLSGLHGIAIRGVLETPQESAFLMSFARHLDPEVMCLDDKDVDSITGKPTFVAAYGKSGVSLAERLAVPYYPLEFPGFLENREPQEASSLKRVVVFGAESTAKTIVTQALGEHFDDVYTDEYARIYFDAINRDCLLGDMTIMGKGLIAYEEALRPYAKRLMICDTMPLTTGVWSDSLFQRQDDWFREIGNHWRYDYYLMMDLDLPYVYDPQRCFPEPADRLGFHQRIIQAVARHGINPIMLSGSPSERIDTAISEIGSRLRP